jgi:putative ferrous iron transport protein C
MILSDLKNYVKSRQQVSLTDMALHFDAEPEAIKGMMEFWIGKGKIKKYSNNPVCGGGCSCSYKEAEELYAWNPQLEHISIEVS